MALHLEHGSLAVAEIDDAGVLARALDDLRRLWSAASSATPARICRSNARTTSPRRCRARSAIGSRPEHGEQQLVFVGLKPMLGDQVRRDLRGGLVHAEEANRLAAAGPKTRAEALTEWIAGSSPAMTKPTTRRGFPPGP